MSDAIRSAYDENAELYASLFGGEIAEDSPSRHSLTAFGGLALECGGPVADLGCGPGGVTHFLSQLGLSVTGYDISPGQVEQAEMAYPSETFLVGDLSSLEQSDSTLGGIVARHSIIHLEPSILGEVFDEWARALQPGAPVFVSFFGSLTAADHGQPFDHKVVTAYELFAPTVEELLVNAGLDIVSTESIRIPEGGRPFNHVTIIAKLQLGV